MSAANRRERERRERREAILDAAETVFGANGLASATMDGVAATAELSKGALYLYFKSKDDLFVALASRIMDSILCEFETAARDAPSGLAELRALLETYTTAVSAHPQHFRTAVAWLSSGDHVDVTTPAFADYRQRVSAIIARFVGAIRRGKTDGTVRTDQGDLEMAASLWGAIMGTLILHTNAAELMRRVQLRDEFHRDIEPEALIPGTIRTLCRGLEPDGDPEVSS